jgi:hypothetical protein
MSAVLQKYELFRELGYGGSHDLLESALEDTGLSRRSKRAIAAGKRAAVAAVLDKRFIAVCSRGDCQTLARASDDERVVVAAASPAQCELCSGTPNARAVDEMVDAMCRAGLRRLCVVGGSPSTRTELALLVGDRLELRLIDGVISRTSAHAQADLVWADRVAIWGATQLDHSVSLLYRGRHVIQLARRGIRQLAREVRISIDD